MDTGDNKNFAKAVIKALTVRGYELYENTLTDSSPPQNSVLGLSSPYLTNCSKICISIATNIEIANSPSTSNLSKANYRQLRNSKIIVQHLNL